MTAVASPLSGLCVDLTSCVWVSLGAMVGGGAGMNNSGMSDAEITKIYNTKYLDNNLQ